MTELTIDEKYEKEVIKQAADHHKPTAAAMLGHALSNLFFEKVVLTQAGIFAKMPDLRMYFRDLATQEDLFFYKISDLLVDLNETVPSTIDEFIQYHQFISEDPKRKYWTDEMLVESFITDFQNQNLFLTRAIKLSRLEEKFTLSVGITELYGHNLSVIRHLAGHLGKTVADFIEEDEDNEDND